MQYIRDQYKLDNINVLLSNAIYYVHNLSEKSMGKSHFLQTFT